MMTGFRSFGMDLIINLKFVVFATMDLLVQSNLPELIRVLHDGCSTILGCRKGIQLRLVAQALADE